MHPVSAAVAVRNTGVRHPPEHDTGLTVTMVGAGAVLPTGAKRIGEPIESLSTQERQLIRLLAEGYNSKEIAGKLLLTRSTVDTHRSQLMNKLGLGHRSETVRFALHNGLLQFE